MSVSVRYGVHGMKKTLSPACSGSLHHEPACCSASNRKVASPTPFRVPGQMKTSDREESETEQSEAGRLRDRAPQSDIILAAVRLRSAGQRDQGL